MEIREVEKKIKGCLGGTFTGKIAVRIAEGKIVACDVGEFGTGMPWIGPKELMKRVVNKPEPSWREFMNEEERQELAGADAALEDATRLQKQRHEAWFVARDASSRGAREAGSAMRLDESADGGPEASIRAQEKLADLEQEAQAAWAAYSQSLSILDQASIAQSKAVRRIQARCRRRMEKAEAEANPSPEQEPPSVTPENWSAKLKAGLGLR